MSRKRKRRPLPQKQPQAVPEAAPPAPPTEKAAPPETPVSRWLERLTLAAAVIGPLALYALTTAHTVVLEDDGLFLMAAASFGVAHPPGYPLYTLICHLFMQLPFGSPAFLGHLSSGVLGALACGAVWFCARYLGAGPVSALAAAWIFGASEHVWSQAIIAEVYALNALLFFAIYALLLKAAQNEEAERDRALIWAAVLYGLSLANHWPLMGLASFGLLLAAVPVWQAVRSRWVVLLGGSLSAATLPYVWMVVRSHSDAFFNFYGPIDSLKMLWFQIGRQGYAHVDTSPSATWVDQLQFLQWLGHELVWQPTLAGFLLALLGFWVLLRMKRWAAVGSGLLVILGNGPMVILLMGLDFDSFYISIFRPFSLICYGILALWAAVGLHWLLERLFRKSWPVAAPAATAALVGTCMAGASVAAHWSVNNQADANFTETYARAILDSLPENAVFVVYDDVDVGLLGYYHFVEKWRPDIMLTNSQGLLFGQKIIDWSKSTTKKIEALRTFFTEAEVRIFFPSDPLISKLGMSMTQHGFITELLPNQEGEYIGVNFHPQAAAYFAHLLAWQPAHRWERLFRNKRMSEFGRYLGYFLLSSDTDAELMKRLEPSLLVAEQNYYSLGSMSSVLLEHGGAEHNPQIADWLEKMQPFSDPSMKRKRDVAYFFYMQGMLQHRLGDNDKARVFFRKSWRAHTDPKNPSLDALQRLTQPWRNKGGAKRAAPSSLKRPLQDPLRRRADN